MTILTSIHGRLLGLDNQGNLETTKGFSENNITAASTAANIKNNGVTTLGSTGAVTYNIDSPVPGIMKTLVQIGVSTGAVVSSTASGATMLSTATGTSTKATFLAKGQALRLIGLTTAQWGILSNVGGIAFSS